jgi:hypothetical protein
MSRITAFPANVWATLTQGFPAASLGHLLAILQPLLPLTLAAMIARRIGLLPSKRFQCLRGNRGFCFRDASSLPLAYYLMIPVGAARTGNQNPFQHHVHTHIIS